MRVIHRTVYYIDRPHNDTDLIRALTLSYRYILYPMLHTLCIRYYTQRRLRMLYFEIFVPCVIYSIYRHNLSHNNYLAKRLAVIFGIQTLVTL